MMRIFAEQSYKPFPENCEWGTLGSDGIDKIGQTSSDPVESIHP